MELVILLKNKKNITNTNILLKTLPKALRTQALTALTSNFGLVGLVQYAWKWKVEMKYVCMYVCMYVRHHFEDDHYFSS